MELTETLRNASGRFVVQTDRTVLRKITREDSGFILDLLNQPSFIRYIGDRNVRSPDQASAYIDSRIIRSYTDNGFGMYLVEMKAAEPPAEPLGLCGFVKRDALPEPDLGFAFLPRFWGRGFAYEAAEAVMRFGRTTLGLGRVLAITTQDNDGSVRLLKKLAFSFEGLVKIAGDENELNLFVSDPAA